MVTNGIYEDVYLICWREFHLFTLRENIHRVVSMKKIFVILSFVFFIFSSYIVQAMQCRGEDFIDIIVGECKNGNFRGFPYDMLSTKIYVGKCSLGSMNIVKEKYTGISINIECPYTDYQKLLDQKPIKEKQIIERKKRNLIEHNERKEKAKIREEMRHQKWIVDNRQKRIERQKKIENCLSKYSSSFNYNYGIKKEESTNQIRNHTNEKSKCYSIF